MYKSVLLIAALVLFFSAQVSTKKIRSQIKTTDEKFMETIKKQTAEYVTGFAYDGEFYPYLYDGQKACEYHGEGYWKNTYYTIDEKWYNGKCYNECYCDGLRKCDPDYNCFGQAR